MEEFYDLVEHAIDGAFEREIYLFKCYQYLQHVKATRRQVREFIESSTAGSTALLVSDLDAYIKGGNDADHKYLREAYGHLGKPSARKMLGNTK